MEDNNVLGEDLPLPPAGLFERLAHIPGYTWDQSVRMFSRRFGFKLNHIRRLNRSIRRTTIGI